MRKSGGTFELSDERVERALLVVRRTEIAQSRVRFARDPIGKGHQQTRFADPGLARDQHYLSFAGLRLMPAQHQQVKLFVAPYQGCGLRAQRLEAADDAALADNAPGALRFGKTGERLKPEIIEFEQGADLTSRV